MKALSLSARRSRKCVILESVDLSRRYSPFATTTDVSVLGIKPIPDIYNHIARLAKDLSRDYADIPDVEYEEVDLEEDKIFPDKAPSSNVTDEP